MRTTNSQTLFKALLILQTISVAVYTYFTIQADGWNFFAAAIEHLASMQWKGQFSLDFFAYLLLSALWIGWRNRYSTQAIVLSVTALIFGILFLAPYLIYLISTHNGNLRAVLVGERK